MQHKTFKQVSGRRRNVGLSLLDGKKCTNVVGLTHLQPTRAINGRAAARLAQ